MRNNGVQTVLFGLFHFTASSCSHDWDKTQESKQEEYLNTLEYFIIIIIIIFSITFFSVLT